MLRLAKGWKHISSRCTWESARVCPAERRLWLRLTVQPAPSSCPAHQLEQGAGRAHTGKDTSTGSTIKSSFASHHHFPLPCVSIPSPVSKTPSRWFFNISSSPLSLSPPPACCRDSKKPGKKEACPIYLSNPSNPFTPFLPVQPPSIVWRKVKKTSYKWKVKKKLANLGLSILDSPFLLLPIQYPAPLLLHLLFLQHMI